MVMPRPRTFLNLLLVGFVIVSLPLTVGLFSTRSYLNKLDERSSRIIENTMGGIRDSQALTEYLINEERYLRLYEIVEAPKHLSKAVDWHRQSTDLLQKIQELPVAGDQRKHMLVMAAEMKELESQLDDLQASSVSKKEAITAVFKRLNDLHVQGKKVGSDVIVWVENEVDNMGLFVQKARRTLAYQTVGFIFLTILMIGVFAVLISWPIRQLNRSVERLGSGDFSSPIYVVGPKDIEIVAEKLEWLRKRLACLEEEKTKFLANISHELKTPLTSIREGAGLLSEEVVGTLDEKQRQVASILVSNSIKLQRLIDDILKVNMSEVGKREVKREMIKLNWFLEKIAGEQANKVLSKKLKLEMNLQDVIIFGNKKEIEDIFQNLFSNAVKFSPVGGIIRCSMKIYDKKVSCLITDEGRGVPSEQMVKIFDRYYTLQNAVDGNEEGSGLGLAIVKEYVGNHGGAIEVISCDEPGGRFQVTLPLDLRQ